MTRHFLLAFACAAALLATGCGARSYVVAPDSKYPVSMSPAVRGPEGKVLRGGDLEKLGTLRLNYHKCNMLWTLIPLFLPTEDISDDINEQVSSRGGEAVINLSVESGATVWNVVTFLGVLPDCASVKVRGDIVSRKEVFADAPASPEPLAPVVVR